jgi:hypothetical protein
LPKDLNDVGGFAPRIKQNMAAGGFVETGQTVKYRGFSRTVWPDKRGYRPALHFEVNVV